MIAASAVLSLAASGVQLYLAYDSDRERVANELVIVEESFRSGLESALWTFNDTQVEVLLDGILAQHDIVFVRLVTPTDRTWTKGLQKNGNLVLKDFELFYHGKPNRAVPVGTLTAGLSLEFIQARLWKQFWALLLSNFAKAILASIAMLAIFDRLAARHLRAIARQADTQWLEEEDLVTIDRRPGRVPDELDDIVRSLNQARGVVRAAHAQIKEKVAELGALNDKLADMNREQAEFTYAISHDLKSPTNTVRMLLDELRQINAGKLDDDSIETLDDLDTTVTRMGQLVEDVLAYARSVGEDMSTKPVDLKPHIESVITDLASDVSNAGAEISVGELPIVTGSAVQLRLLFQNLIANAIKFRHPSRCPKIEISRRPDDGSGFVKVDVKDNGIGIDEKYHDEVFGLFKRLHTQSAYKGSGIGLTVCQRIVSNHRGTIGISSKAGEGSTFTVTLPENLDVD
ncbi:MAG: ATP-binding protein [Pseudomonadota bacterium]